MSLTPLDERCPLTTAAPLRTISPVSTSEWVRSASSAVLLCYSASSFSFFLSFFHFFLPFFLSIPLLPLPPFPSPFIFSTLFSLLSSFFCPCTFYNFSLYCLPFFTCHLFFPPFFFLTSICLSAFLFSLLSLFLSLLPVILCCSFKCINLHFLSFFLYFPLPAFLWQLPQNAHCTLYTYTALTLSPELFSVDPYRLML
jgi:hypothetical protein